MNDKKQESVTAKPAGAELGGAAWSTEVQMQIGARLARIYDELMRETPPEEFRLLLDQLDRSAKARARKERD